VPFIGLCVALCGCGADEHLLCPAEGGTTSGLEALAAPSPVWTHASENATYYAPRAADLEDDGKLEVLAAGGSQMPPFGELSVMDGMTGFVRWKVGADA
jgi:hypothetical protein